MSSKLYTGPSPMTLSDRIRAGVVLQVEESGPFRDRFIVAFQMTGKELRDLHVLDAEPPPETLTREQAERLPELTPELQAAMAVIKKTFG